MSIEHDLLLWGSSILQKIHTGYIGIAKCGRRAWQGIQWPGLSKQLEQVVKTCEECRHRGQNLYSHLHYLSYLSKRWEQTCSNGMEKNTCWSSTTLLWCGSTLHDLLSYDYPTHQQHLCKTWHPEVLVSGNGPQYTSSVTKHLPESTGSFM